MGKVISIEDKLKDKDFERRAQKVADAVDQYDGFDLGDIAEEVVEPSDLPAEPSRQVTGEKEHAAVPQKGENKAPDR